MGDNSKESDQPSPEPIKEPSKFPSSEEFSALSYAALIELLTKEMEKVHYLQFPKASRITAALLKAIALSQHTCLGISSLKYETIRYDEYLKLKEDSLEYLVIYDDKFQTDTSEDEKTVRVLSLRTDKVILKFVVNEFPDEILNNYDLLAETVARSLVLEFMKRATDLATEPKIKPTDNEELKPREISSLSELLADININGLLPFLPTSKK